MYQQASEATYLIIKARRLNDEALRLSHAAAQAPVVSQGPPLYLANRVEDEGGVAALPGVEVRDGLLARMKSGRRKSPKRMEEGFLRKEVVGHVVGGLRGELLRELMEM
jgi:hypothetical protein